MRNEEVYRLFNEFYDGRVSPNKKEVMSDLEMYLNRYNVVAKFVVILQRCRQTVEGIELDVRVRLRDDENEFMDFHMIRKVWKEKLGLYSPSIFVA